MTDGEIGRSRRKVISERWRVRVFVGLRVGLGWLWIITHRGVQRRKGGIEVRVGIELVQIMILWGCGLGLRWVKGKLTGKIVVGMRWRMLLLLLLLVIVRRR
jgi:hypothetical protein